jgi:alanine racemase
MRHNLRVAKERAPQARAWAVVKANGYGHGLLRAMRGFAAADGLALIEPENAAALRQAGWARRIALLEGCFDAADVALAQEHDIEIAVHSHEQIVMLETASRKTPVHVHLKMNSGMNRLGFRPDEFRAAYARLSALPQVRSLSLATHFANADDAGNPALPMQVQLDRFMHACDGLEGERSLANSAADLLHAHAAGDWIRPGIMLYGGTPGARTAADFGLRAAMTLSSEIIAVQEIRQGEAVGYGSRFVASKDMRIGVVACGYADGYPRHAPDGTPVLVDGVRTGIAGRVSMDMMTVDLSQIPLARIGSTVELWGAALPIDEVAGHAGTIGYELMCALAPRVRVVEREDAPI